MIQNPYILYTESINSYMIGFCWLQIVHTSIVIP